MSADENGRLVGELYAAFARGDLEALRKGLADDIAWHVQGSSLVSGHFHGTDAVFAYLGRLGELTGGSLTVSVHDLLASEDHVVVLQTENANLAGKSASLDYVAVWHVRGGLATEVWMMPVDAGADDAFWGPPE